VRGNEELSFMNGNLANIQRNQHQNDLNLNSNRSRTAEVLQRRLQNPLQESISQVPRPMQGLEELRNRNKVRIRTQVKKNEIKFMDNYPQEED